LLLLLVGHLIGWNLILKPFILFFNRDKLQGQVPEFYFIFKVIIIIIIVIIIIFFSLKPKDKWGGWWVP
jgi:hypothetical protein